jgi:uncharacterized protein (TIGR02266 family)
VARRRILVAGESALFGELQSIFLSRVAEVITSSDGEQALAALRRERPGLVVADLHMPGMTGDALCRAIRADPELSDTPVIILTSDEAGEERERAVRAGAADVIALPIDRLTFIESVNGLLTTRRLGLTRVPLETEVRFHLPPRDAYGAARDLSRGGMFVETGEPPEPETEIGLHFALPDSAVEIAPTARVVWRRVGVIGAPSGMGLQFLRLDRRGVERIDRFVREHARDARRRVVLWDET